MEALLRRAWNEGEPDEQIIAAAVLAETGDELPDLSEHEALFVGFGSRGEKSITTGYETSNVFLKFSFGRGEGIRIGIVRGHAFT